MNPDAVDSLRDAGGSERERDGHLDERGRVPHGGTDDPWVLDFSANTNPRVPAGTARVYQAALAAARSYPADAYCEFRAAAADVVGTEATQVVPTPGGLAAIRLAIQTAVAPGETVLVPAPSFGEYAREVRLQGAEPVFVPADEVLDADPADHAMAVVCNPNNPTGRAYDTDALREFARRCRAADATLLVDEAFLGFTDRPSLAGTDGVVVARSLTKLYGLPGLRAGYAVATGDRLARLETARLPWSLGTAAAATGAHCLERRSFVRETRERVAGERSRLRERLAAAYDVAPAAANYLLVDAGDAEAVEDLIARARTEGIAVRDARTFRGLDSHVRIAVREPEENDRLLDALGV